MTPVYLDYNASALVRPEVQVATKQHERTLNAARLASETRKRSSSAAWGQSSGSAIWSGPCFTAQARALEPGPEPVARALAG